MRSSLSNVTEMLRSCSYTWGSNISDSYSEDISNALQSNKQWVKELEIVGKIARDEAIRNVYSECVLNLSSSSSYEDEVADDIGDSCLKI